MMSLDFIPGEIVAYGAEERLYSLVDGLDKADPNLVVCRVYKVLRPSPNLDAEPAIVEPFEGGAPIECFGHFLHKLSVIPSKDEGRYTQVRLRRSDHLQLGQRSIGVFLAESSLGRKYPGNKRSLSLNGLVCGRTYHITSWSVPNKAVTLEGAKGVYMVHLFVAVGASACSS